MEFQKNDIIKFLNISLQTTPGEGCGPQANEVNKLPKRFLPDRDFLAERYENYLKLN